MFERPLDEALGLAERLRETERQIAVLHGEQMHLMALLYARAPEWINAPEDTAALADAADVAAAEIGVALRVSRRSATDRLGMALSLRHMPDTAAALDSGELSLAKTRIIVDAVGDLSEEAAAQVQARVLPRAGGQTLAGLGVSVARAVLAADPDAAARRRSAAVRERGVRFSAGPDGMASLWARLPAEEALGCYRELCELAELAAPTDEVGDPLPGPDIRTADARRADTLVDLIMGAGLPRQCDGPCCSPWTAADAATDAADELRGDRACGSDRDADSDSDAHAGPGADPVCGGGSDRGSGGAPDQARCSGWPYRRARRASLDVTVAWTTLAGLDEQPGWLNGYGPIHPDVARRLAADGTWRRLLTDPATGTVLDVGTTRYTPPKALADLVRARDATCRWYGCRLPAARCDLDHTVPFPHGPTATTNLAGLCRGHHRIKTHTTWRVEQDAHGVLAWTSPLGQRITTVPWPQDHHPPARPAPAPVPDG